MSSDFTKILVKDDRMECCDNIKYAVIKGGQNVTPSQFKAISISNNQLVFNIQVPSEQTLIDRRVLLSTDLQLVVRSTSITWTIANPAAVPPIVGVAPAYTLPASGCGYGAVGGLGSYPLHSLMTVASATINNNTVSINMKDVLPAIIRLLDKKELGSYNGMTATATDSLLSYGNQANGAAASLGSFGVLDTDYVGRGSLVLKSYSAAADPTTPTDMLETFTWNISEPLMLSPFIYSNPKSNGQAFYGIQNMNIVLNIGADLSRVFRGCGYVDGLSTASPPAVSATCKYPSPSGLYNAAKSGFHSSLPIIKAVTPGSFSDTQSMFSNTYLFFTFLTAHPSDLFPARNIVPYYELPRYITSSTAGVPLLPTLAENNFVTQGYSDLLGDTLISQTLQLNQIPDKLIMFIRKQKQTWYDADAYLPINQISINFNNNSGLLSAARNVDLYRMAKDNGSNQSWNEWLGYQTCSTIEDVDGVFRPSQGWSQPGSNFCSIATVGSVMVLEFGKDIQLIEDFFAPGSLGNFNIQLNVRYQNNNSSIDTSANNAAPGTSNAIELVMITMNSGVFVCERGTSSTYTGILTRADVLEASEQDAYTRSDVQRLVGGGFLDMLKSGVSKLSPLLKAVAPMAMPYVKDYLGKKGTLGAMANAGLGAMGYGHSGGGMSGGGASGGRLQGRYA